MNGFHQLHLHKHNVFVLTKASSKLPVNLIFIAPHFTLTLFFIEKKKSQLPTSPSWILKEYFNILFKNLQQRFPLKELKSE